MSATYSVVPQILSPRNHQCRSANVRSRQFIPAELVEWDPVLGLLQEQVQAQCVPLGLVAWDPVLGVLQEQAQGLLAGLVEWHLALGFLQQQDYVLPAGAGKKREQRQVQTKFMCSPSAPHSSIPING
ncbi:hypothetical protein CB1_000115001 [Camelus ferus]|nr:hypothetical protein CB1_000115001 [Camelus ferus]